jgi:hypothetical protein
MHDHANELQIFGVFSKLIRQNGVASHLCGVTKTFLFVSTIPNIPLFHMACLKFSVFIESSLSSWSWSWTFERSKTLGRKTTI